MVEVLALKENLPQCLYYLLDRLEVFDFNSQKLFVMELYVHCPDEELSGRTKISVDVQNNDLNFGFQENWSYLIVM